MHDITPAVAETFKQLRAERGLSLSQAAQLTGVSKAMLGQIERGQSSPTVSTLWKIATGFNVAFSVFLEGAQPQVQAGLHSFATLPVFEQTRSGMRVTPLIPFDDELKTDLLKIDLLPGRSVNPALMNPGLSNMSLCWKVHYNCGWGMSGIPFLPGNPCAFMRISRTLTPIPVRPL